LINEDLVSAVEVLILVHEDMAECRGEWRVWVVLKKPKSDRY